MPDHPADRTLFVTGGSGLLGRHVVAAARTVGWRVVAPTSTDLDLRDPEAVRDTVSDARPRAVVHTAYRRDERAAIVDATRHVVAASCQVGARLVHVSTDALFAGRSDAYREHDAPDPVHDYGRWKAEAELDVARADPTAVIVRTSLLFASDEPSPHEDAVHAVVTGRSSMSFFADEVRSPVLVEDLAAALVRLAGASAPTGVLHLGGPDPLSRAELAVMIARRRGWPEDHLRFSTIAESGLARPARVVLDSTAAARLGFRLRGPAAWS